MRMFSNEPAAVQCTAAWDQYVSMSFQGKYVKSSSELIFVGETQESHLKRATTCTINDITLERDIGMV